MHWVFFGNDSANTRGDKSEELLLSGSSPSNPRRKKDGVRLSQVYEICISYQSVHNCMDIGNQISPSLPLQKGGIPPLWKRGATYLREAASAKAGGRFSQQYVFSIMDSLVIERTMKCTEPLVSVVIPTRNRPYLVARAVHSALTQSLVEIEVIVVIDGPDEMTLHILDQIDDHRLRVSMLPRHLGLSDARNGGVREARSQWIAFLDDDDEWLPQKLEIQLQTAKQSAYDNPIISCRIIARTPAGDFFWPLRFPRPNELLSEYLICRRNPISGEGLISPSTILTKKELLRRVPFKSDLWCYEDVDWLLRTSTQEGVGVEFVARFEPLTICHMEEDHNRISTGIDWNDSLSWIKASRHLVTPRAYASFLMTRPALFASRQGDWKAFLPLLYEAYRYYRPGILDVLPFLGIWLIPQKAKRLIATFLARRSRNVMLKKGSR